MKLFWQQSQYNKQYNKQYNTAPLQHYTMAHELPFDLISKILGDVHKIKVYQRRHIPKKHMKGLALCFQEAQFDSAHGCRWSREERLDDSLYKTYQEYWKCPEVRESVEEFLRYEGYSSMLECCKDLVDLNSFGCHYNQETGTYRRILNKW